MDALQMLVSPMGNRFSNARHSHDKERALLPFKTKGGLIQYMQSLDELARQIEQQEHDFVQRQNLIVRQYGQFMFVHVEAKRFSRLPKIRWRNVESRRMGDQCFAQAMQCASTESERRKLFEIELERIAINNQAGVLNGIQRRLKASMKSIEMAEKARDASSAR
ncbi:DUF3158 family protein [Azotobacter vinelandii]|uniref:DUF3158 family protein n=1 Tax=Azotobacter vinelandii TaxID=354 RepID=UPI0007743E3D|nr:DUF3158 family protein [Azotobacter vinelandii]